MADQSPPPSQVEGGTMSCRTCHAITSDFYLVKTRKGRSAYCKDCYEKIMARNQTDDFPQLVKQSKVQF